MIRRTTIELDEELLARAKRALGCGTTRATIHEALRRATVDAESERSRRAEGQRDYLRRMRELADLDVMASDEMWRR